MRKNFVLDTNVLLHDPGAISGFDDNNVCVPIYVIEEIDNFKKELSELGRNAREISRVLDHYRSKGNLGTGVPLETGGNIRVLFSSRHDVTDAEFNHRDINQSHIMDRLIMGTALELKVAEPDFPLVFVTKDTNLRIMAEAMGLIAVDYDKENKEVSELYTGIGEIQLDGELISEFFRVGHVRIPEGTVELPENQYILIRNETKPSQSALARAATAEGRFYKTVEVRDSVWGIKPRNKEQHFAFDALLRDDVSLVTLIGKAGTGKTLLAIAAGLQKVTDEQAFSRMLVSRPIFPMGRDIGYLPGDVEQKLNPWMQPIYDNLELLMGFNKQDRKGNRSAHELMDMNLITVEPLTYIRGRSIPNQYMIVDEAQNLTPHEVKTIITRVGEGTKIVLTGDPYQIDNPYVDSVNNGLVYIAEKFKNSDISATVTLTRGERSRLAELAANLL